MYVYEIINQPNVYSYSHEILESSLKSFHLCQKVHSCYQLFVPVQTSRQ